MSEGVGRSIRLFSTWAEAHDFRGDTGGGSSIGHRILGTGADRYFLYMNLLGRNKYLCEDGQWRIKNDCIITDAAKGPIF